MTTISLRTASAAVIAGLLATLFAGSARLARADVQALHAPEREIICASHAAHVTPRALIWDSTVVMGPSLAFEAPDAPVMLALPLPPDAHVEVLGPPGAAIVVEHNSVVAVRGVPAMASLRLRVTEPLVTGQDTRLGAPLVAGQTAQRLAFDDPEGVRFEPDPRLGVERHLEYSTSPGVTASERARCDALASGSRDEHPTYLIVDDRLLAVGGLVGRLTTADERAHVGGALAVIVFLAAAAAAVFAHRKLGRKAEFELAEATLEAEFASLERAGRPAPQGRLASTGRHRHDGLS